MLYKYAKALQKAFHKSQLRALIMMSMHYAANIHTHSHWSYTNIQYLTNNIANCTKSSLSATKFSKVVTPCCRRKDKDSGPAQEHVAPFAPPHIRSLSYNGKRPRPRRFSRPSSTAREWPLNRNFVHDILSLSLTLTTELYTECTSRFLLNS